MEGITEDVMIKQILQTLDTYHDKITVFFLFLS